MKNIILIVAIFLIPFINITSQSNENILGKKIIGKWKMIKVLEMSKDVTEEHNPGNNRWIKFMPDSAEEMKGIFESGRGEDKENTGKWVINENELFIDSDAGQNDDSYWEISFDADKMYWKGRRFEFNKRFEIVHEKVE